MTFTKPFRSRSFRSILAVLVAFSLAFSVTPAADAAAFARNTGLESGFLASLNAQRAARGIAPLQLDVSMSQSAGTWTANMVDGSFLAHSRNLSGGVARGWSKVGENVGRGQTVSTLTSAFMQSPTHAQNVLDPSFTHVGIAVIVHANGRIYTTHRFAALPGAGRSPVAPPAAPVVVQAPAAPVQVTTVVAPVQVVIPSAPAAPNALDLQRAAAHEARIKLMMEVFAVDR